MFRGKIGLKNEPTLSNIGLQITEIRPVTKVYLDLRDTLYLSQSSCDISAPAQKLQNLLLAEISGILNAGNIGPLECKICFFACMIDRKIVFGLHEATNSMLIDISKIKCIISTQTGRNVSLIRAYQIVYLKKCTFSAFLSVN
jgi:hypothetical protein